MYIYIYRKKQKILSFSKAEVQSEIQTDCQGFELGLLTINMED